MASRFKRRISKVIPSFRSCRSKDTSSLPLDPIPSFLNSLSHVNPSTPPPPYPHRSSSSSFKRHISSAFGCGGHNSSSSRTGSQPHFKWQKEEKWHVVAKVNDDTPRRKIYNTSVSEVSDNDQVLAPPPPPPRATEKMKRRSKKKKTTVKARNRVSTSSADSGWFSSEGGGPVGDEREEEQEQEEETDTLVSSSRSFSTDTSSESKKNKTNKVKKKKKKKKKSSSKRCVSRGFDQMGMCRSSTESGSSPARLSLFKKLIPCRMDEKVKESFAVVKKSKDPYEDFKRSMMEMILEKQMFEKDDLEQLLQCFLSLNSRYHHGVIVEAFSEIWEAMFCTTTRNSSHQRASIAL